MKPHDIVLVKFPFTDLENYKQRPALILSQTTYSKSLQLFTVAMITSKIDQVKINGDYFLIEWKSAGLLHPSLLRLSKVVTIESELIQKTIGTLSPSDVKQFKKNFKLQFKACW